MNKVYKVIWSKVKHCYVVVSEIAKRNSKAKSSGVNGVVRSEVSGWGILTPWLCTLAIVAGSAFVLPMQAEAANNNPGEGSGVAVGSGSVTYTASDVAVGNNATATAPTTNEQNSGTTAVGALSKALGKNSTAYGYEAQAAIIYSSGSAQEALGATAVGAYSVGGQIMQPPWGREQTCGGAEITAWLWVRLLS